MPTMPTTDAPEVRERPDHARVDTAPCIPLDVIRTTGKRKSISTRAFHAFRNAGCKTLEDVAKYTRRNAKDIENIGRDSIEYTAEVLKRYGLWFAGEGPMNHPALSHLDVIAEIMAIVHRADLEEQRDILAMVKKIAGIA